MIKRSPTYVRERGVKSLKKVRVQGVQKSMRNFHGLDWIEENLFYQRRKVFFPTSIS